MLIKNFSVLLLAAVGLASIAVADAEANAPSERTSLKLREALERRQSGRNRFGNNDGGNNGGNNGRNNGGNNGGNAALQLNPANVQTGSQSNGQENGANDGQSPSATDNANFINFCTGKTLTNGLQNRGGSCNGIVMGDLPAARNMVSSIIVSPAPGQDIPANTEFNIVVQIRNLEAGSFTNPDNTYYAAPQALRNGRVIGHTHVTVQDLGGTLTPNQPPNAETFAFFKGINDNGNGQGRLQATVTNGLPPGFYRVCTMSSASNHQPVIMPVAQRGAQDDCQKFTVGQGQNNNNNGGNNGNNNNNNGRPRGRGRGRPRGRG
ncbi:hypothetical protein BDZ91DRAFT_387607 [Kalaharituber pfeilii]|nr:hypothetical protein BDZ91DRAFT_387607 [Kalaharituber pfeilii]